MVSRVVVVLMVASATVAAQQSRDGLSAEAQIQQRRAQFQMMEVLLESAARQGAQEMVMRAQMSLPLGTLFMGNAKAKGFPLDGYGIVFDIEIPIILESQVLLSRMTQPAPAPAGAGNRPVSTGPGTTRATGIVPDDPTDRSPVVTDAFLRDPNAFYRSTVRDKLVEVMLDYSRPLGVPEGEWLSVVARSEDDPVPRVVNDSRTMILRIKGADLAAFHAGKITRDDAKKRVVESQF